MKTENDGDILVEASDVVRQTLIADMDNTELLAAALMKSTPELFAVDTSRRGWAEVTLTPEATTSQWHFVSTVLDKNYTVMDSAPIRCEAGARQFS